MANRENKHCISTQIQAFFQWFSHVVTLWPFNTVVLSLPNTQPFNTVVLTLLMLRTFNTVPYIVLTPTIRLFLLLLCNYNFATILNCNVNIYNVKWLLWKCHLHPSKGFETHRLRITILDHGFYICLCFFFLCMCVGIQGLTWPILVWNLISNLG